MDNLNECWIIDTDYSYASNIALSYLVNKLNIIAITVNSAGTGLKPSVIKRKIEEDLINKYGKPDIKVYAGADRAYINYQQELKDDPIFEAYNYNKIDYSDIKEDETSVKLENSDIGVKISNIAAVKIAENVRLHEHKLNILALGPLTNLSLAVLIDSTIKDKFKHLYIVGGSYNNLGNSGNCAEYNLRVDPVASKNVFMYYKNIVLLPLEIEAVLDLPEIRKIGASNNSNILKPLIESMNSIANESDYEDNRMKYSFLPFWASLIIINPDIIKTKAVRPCDVDIIGRFTRGALAIEKYDYLKSGKFNDVTIIEDIDVDLFMQVFKNLLI